MTTQDTLTITIDADDHDSLRAALAAGITTVEALASWLADNDRYAEVVEDCLVVEQGYRADDGNAEVHHPEAESGSEAASLYVDGGDWGDRTETIWVAVRTWRDAIDADGDECRVEEEDHTITLDAEEPKCLDGHEHIWESPYSLLGGLKENPGVWGHAGGVIYHEVCMLCGCKKTTDTWAQNPSNGEQGLTSVSYSEGEYTDEINERHIKRAKKKLDTGAEQIKKYDFVWEDADGDLVWCNDSDLSDYGIALLLDPDAAPPCGSLIGNDEDE